MRNSGKIFAPSEQPCEVLKGLVCWSHQVKWSPKPEDLEAFNAIQLCSDGGTTTPTGYVSWHVFFKCFHRWILKFPLGFALQLPMVLDFTRWLKTCVLKQGMGSSAAHWKLWIFSKISRRMRQSVSPGLWWSRFKTKSHPYLWSVEDCRDWRRHKRLFQKGRYSLKSKRSPQIRLFCPSFWGSMILRESYGTMENANMLRSWKKMFHRRYVAALDLLATQALELSRFCADNHSCCASIFVSPRYHALCTTTPLMSLTSLASHCLPWNQQHSWNWYMEVSNMCFIRPTTFNHQLLTWKRMHSVESVLRHPRNLNVMSSSLKKSLAIPIVLSWSCGLHTALFVWIHPWDLVCDWRQAANCSRATEKEAPISRTNGRQQRFFRDKVGYPFAPWQGAHKEAWSSEMRKELLYPVRRAVLIFSVNWWRVKFQRVNVVLTSRHHPHEIAILRQAKQSAPTSEQTEKVNLLSIFFYENISCPLG